MNQRQMLQVQAFKKSKYEIDALLGLQINQLLVYSLLTLKFQSCL